MEHTRAALDLCDRTVGEIVAEDFRRAHVFKKHGIDYCCGGNRPVRDACHDKGISCDEILRDLAEADQQTVDRAPDHLDARSWEPDFLAHYIVNVHHRYVREHTPRLRELTQTVARVHGKDNPETVRIAGLFDELARELDAHLTNEEQELFPAIEKLVAASRGEVDGWRRVDEDVDVRLDDFEHDHDRAGDLLRAIRTLSADFEAPATACTTYRMAYAELERFESDLHRHVHLENNILFPAAARLEQDLARPW